MIIYTTHAACSNNDEWRVCTISENYDKIVSNNMIMRETIHLYYYSHLDRGPRE